MMRTRVVFIGGFSLWVCGRGPSGWRASRARALRRFQVRVRSYTSQLGPGRRRLHSGRRNFRDGEFRLEAYGRGQVLRKRVEHFHAAVPGDGAGPLLVLVAAGVAMGELEEVIGDAVAGMAASGQ